MQRLKDEIKRQLEANKRYVDNNFMYDYEKVENMINNLFSGEMLNIDIFTKLMSVDYLQENLNEIKKTNNVYLSLKNIVSLLENGIVNIDEKLYEKSISSLNPNLVRFIEKLNINLDDIKIYKSLSIDDNSGLNNTWIDEFIKSAIEAISKKQNDMRSEISELIKGLKNSLSKYRYPNANTLSGGKDKIAKAMEINVSIEACKSKIRDLEEVLDTCFRNDEIEPCKKALEYEKLIKLVKDSQLDDSIKQVIMLKIRDINLEYLNSIRNRNENAIISEIDRNASLVNEEIENQYEQNEREINLEETEELENISFDDVISNDSISALALNDEEMVKFQQIRKLIEDYIIKNGAKSNIFNNEENLYILELIEEKTGDKREDYAIDMATNKIFWDFVITDLHKNQKSKESVLEIIDIVSSALQRKEQIDRQNEIIAERFDKFSEIIAEIDDYIKELVKIYKPEREQEKNEIIVDLTNFGERLNNPTDEMIYNDSEYEKTLNIYDAIEERFNNFYSSEVSDEIEDLDNNFDVNDSNYIIFDDSVKKQLKKFKEGFYRAQIIYSINFIRSKEKMNGISKETSVKLLNEGKVHIYEVKDRKTRMYFTKINNNTFYVSGIMKKLTEGGSKVDKTINNISRLGNQKADEYKALFQTMSSGEIHNLCESSYQSVIDILDKEKDTVQQLGGASNGNN